MLCQIFAGENVCIYLISPAHFETLIAQRHNVIMAHYVFRTGLGTTFAGITLLWSIAAAILMMMQGFCLQE
jgi:hypothetical protein